jgi:hypothetical protein
VAFSYVLYNGDGATTNFVFSFPYLESSHIKVRVDGVLTPYTFLNSSTVTISPAPAGGTVIEIRRETPKDNPPVDFADGSVLLERDLDLLADFSLYVAQEADDGVKQSITQTALGVWDAQNRRITEVADPTNDQDAVNKRYFDGTFLPTLQAQVTAATTQANNAATSASAASGSASAAATSASNAATSASNSASSATASASSASAASTSASNAAGSASAAATSASQASTSASNAASSASTATTQANNAATSATNAANSATAAATSATNAANSATAAATSASNAAGSATSAANSASAAADTYDQFDDRYLGAKASNPATDNDGDPLITGALYFNTVANEMRVYDGAIWKAAGATVNGTAIRQTFTATAGQTTFAITGGYDAGFADVYLNGVKLVNGVDVTVTSGTDVVLTVGASAGDTVDVIAYGAFLIANTYTQAEADALLAGKQEASPVLTSYASSGFGFRNRIINGDMRIDQRNNGAAVSSTGAYPVDRFRVFRDGGAATFTAQRSTTAPSGFNYSVVYTVGTGATPASTDFSGLQQNIEGFNVADLMWGTASAQPFTLSFLVRSSVTGTFGIGIRNADVSRSYVTTFTISQANTFELKTITIPGDTSGTWVADNGVGLSVTWDLGAGSTRSTSSLDTWQAGNFFGAASGIKLISTSGATFYLTGVQVERGTVATPFEFRSIGQELALCQRYYQKLGLKQSAYIASGNTATTSIGILYTKYTTTMRASPTTNFLNLSIGDGWNYGRAVTSFGTSSLGTDSANIRANIAETDMVANRPCVMFPSADTGYLDLSAEL